MPAILALLAVLVPAVAAAVTEEERQRLGRGETIVRWEDEPAGPPAVVGLRLLDDEPERVFRTIADYRHYDEFMPFLVESEVISGDAARSEVRQVLDPPFPLRRRECRVILRSQVAAAADDRWQASWELVPGSGNLREHRGEWSLWRYEPGRTLVVFRWVHDPGGSMPRSLVARAIERSVPWVLDGLRQQVRRCRYDDPPPPGCNDG